MKYQQTKVGEVKDFMGHVKPLIHGPEMHPSLYTKRDLIHTLWYFI